MPTNGTNFIQFALAQRVLQFGDFKLKSGRSSPYFFNLGTVVGGSALTELGRFYAAAIVASKVQPEVIFGPAYKGIPLAALTASCLHQLHDINTAVAYNRKELKGHGEGGQLVGAELSGRRVLIVDDVMTAGTAVREAINLIQQAGGRAVAVVIGFDRREAGTSASPAVSEIERQYGLRVISIADLDDLLACADDEQRTRLEAYRTACADEATGG